MIQGREAEAGRGEAAEERRGWAGEAAIAGGEGTREVDLEEGTGHVSWIFESAGQMERELEKAVEWEVVSG